MRRKNRLKNTQNSSGSVLNDDEKRMSKREMKNGNSLET